MSTGLFYLTNNDFNLIETSKDNVNLCINIEGYALILFYSIKCNYCKNLLPIFKELPESVGGCVIGMINIDQNKQIIEKSKKTKVAITYVPYIVFYINGLPFMRYDGEHDKNQLKQFIIDTAEKLSKNGSQSKTTEPSKNMQYELLKNQSQKPRPRYTLGKPKNSETFGQLNNYNNFDSAYKSGTNKRPNRNPDVEQFTQGRFQ